MNSAISQVKVGGLEQIVRIQKEASAALEEEVFAIRRSAPTIDRIADAVRKAISSQESAEVELVDIKERLNAIGQLANQSASAGTELAQQNAKLTKLQGNVDELGKQTEQAQHVVDRVESMSTRLQQVEQDLRSTKETAEKLTGLSRTTNAAEVSADLNRIERDLSNLFDTVSALSAQVDARSYVDESSRFTSSAIATSYSTDAQRSPISARKPAAKTKKEPKAESSSTASGANAGQQVLDEISKVRRPRIAALLFTTPEINAASLRPLLV